MELFFTASRLNSWQQPNTGCIGALDVAYIPKALARNSCPCKTASSWITSEPIIAHWLGVLPVCGLCALRRVARRDPNLSPNPNLRAGWLGVTCSQLLVVALHWPCCQLLAHLPLLLLRTAMEATAAATSMAHFRMFLTMPYCHSILQVTD
jgi:hypothetical protein